MPDAPDQTAVFAFFEALGAASQDPARFRRIDTHANVVFLIDDYAYKLKRAVKYPFLDYSTLQLRGRACKREITCNLPQAPQLYIEAVPVTRGGEGEHSLGGNGIPVDWAVKMHRFDRSNELDRVADRGPLSDLLVDQLADMMVAAHEIAPPREAAVWFAELEGYTAQNEAAFADYPDLFPPARAHHLAGASRSWLARIKALIMARGAQGLIRLCHGDAHLRNIVLVKGHPVLFDAVEFNDDIATGDVLYDLAFLLMDLWERGQRRAANRLFNRYFDKARRSDDLDALSALPFYLMMRASIRAKIAASSAEQQSDEALKTDLNAQAKVYFDLACALLEPQEPQLVAIGGLSGTGKTTLAYNLAPDIGRCPGARVLRSDVERKAVLGLTETDKAPDASYTQAQSDAIYHALEQAADQTLSAGHSVILDAVHARPQERQHIRNVARKSETRFAGLWLEAAPDIMKERVESRTGDASDATVEIVERQLGYDLGEISWTRIEAGASPDAVLDEAKTTLGIGGAG